MSLNLSDYTIMFKNTFKHIFLTKFKCRLKSVYVGAEISTLTSRAVLVCGFKDQFVKSLLN